MVKKGLHARRHTRERSRLERERERGRRERERERGRREREREADERERQTRESGKAAPTAFCQVCARVCHRPPERGPG